MTPDLNAVGSDSSTSIYDSGGSNLDILESVGNDLIDSHAPAGDPGGSGASVSPPSAGADGQAPPAGDAQRPEWFEAAPAELKGLLEHGNVSAPMKKWLEETYGELHDYRSSPLNTKEAIAEVTELFPGGVEDMRVAAEHAQQFTREMEQFRSGDPAQQSELLASLLQDSVGPEAFISLTSGALEMLRETLPKDYTALASGITSGHLNEVTDGKFGTFFDSVRGVAAEYQAKLDAGDQEGAAKLASRLGGYALQMADWWGGAKQKLGFGEKTEGASGAGLPRPSIVTSRGVDPNDREVIYAQRDANYWATNYMMQHDTAVRPMVSQAITRDLAARKLEVPESWKRDVAAFVESGIKQNLARDKQYIALETRVYKRGSPNDPRRWDNSDKVAQVLLNAVKQKSSQLIPSLVKQALDRLQELKGGAARTPRPGEKVASSAGGSSGAGTGSGGDWETELKGGKISGAEAIQRMAGLS